MATTLRKHWAKAGMLLLLAVATACYWPGLQSGFLFDDFVNLDALGNRGPIDNAAAFWRYITSGTADPLGRPLSLLTFLLDARDWPADPLPFLRTNLLIHLLNGVLLFRLLRRLEGSDGPRASATALLATGLWLLHPLLVSTTLYVVQREAMLPATCMLVALHAFVRARQDFIASGGARGFARMALAIGVGTPLAALAKANGMLLPLLAWLLAATMLPAHAAGNGLSGRAATRLRRFDLVALIAPSACIAAYLLLPLLQWNADLPTRPWTIGQRVLTEPRVLVDYLGLLVAPRVLSPGLFNEQIPAATSLWQPLSTLPSLLLVAGACLLALLRRRQWPRVSAAILFFLAGHALESSTIPLELYFEHRNYLPAMLLFWPLAHAIVQWRARPAARVAVAMAVLLLFGGITWQRASLWGQPAEQARIWAMKNPGSARAQASAAMQVLAEGAPGRAADLLLPLWRRSPGELQLAFNYVNARCADRGLSPGDVREVGHALAIAAGGQLLANEWLSRALGMAASGACAGLTLDVVARWLDAAATNPAFAAPGIRDQDLLPLMGELALQRGDGATAARLFNQALAAHPTPDFAARLVSTLASHRHYAEALALLEAFQQMPVAAPRPASGMPWVHWQVMRRQGFWAHEFAALRGKLQADLAATRDGGHAAARTP